MTYFEIVSEIQNVLMGFRIPVNVHIKTKKDSNSINSNDDDMDDGFFACLPGCTTEKHHEICELVATKLKNYSNREISLTMEAYPNSEYIMISKLKINDSTISVIETENENFVEFPVIF